MERPSGQIISRLLDQQKSQYLTVCALCLLVWDIVITLDQEVEHLWKRKSRVTLINILFLLNRWYVPLVFVIRIYRFAVTHPQAKSCIDLGTFVLASQGVNVFVLEAAMAIRVWALYDRSRRVLYFFIFLLGGFAASSVLISTLGISHVRGGGNPTPGQAFKTGCNRFGTHVPPSSSTNYYTYLFLETVFFSMTMYQVFRYGRPATRASLMINVAHTGIAFFFLALVAMLFVLIGSKIPSPLASAFNSNFHTAILSLNCSRLILSIRDAHSQPTPSLHVPTDLELSQVNPDQINNHLQPVLEFSENPHGTGTGTLALEKHSPGNSNRERMTLGTVKGCDGDA